MIEHAKDKITCPRLILCSDVRYKTKPKLQTSATSDKSIVFLAGWCVLRCMKVLFVKSSVSFVHYVNDHEINALNVCLNNVTMKL